jgi:hypothetical protein
VISRQQLRDQRSLFRTHLATRQAPAVVVVFHHAYRAALCWIPLQDRQRAVGAECLEGFGPAIEIIIANFAHYDAARVLLNKIDFSVEVAVALHFDRFVVSDGLDQIGFTVLIGIDRDLVFVVVDSDRLLVGAPVAPSMSYDPIRPSVAGDKYES